MKFKDGTLYKISKNEKCFKKLQIDGISIWNAQT